MDKPTPDRPLVTFAMFAYNQERCVHKAIEGAFSQSYSPLEIILSDDCSTDRTFDVMQRMAAQYDGPHKVVLNKNKKNLGIGGHVRRMSELASGEWVIMAAGDDVSLPQRAEKVVETANRYPNAFAIAVGVSSQDRTITNGSYHDYTAQILNCWDVLQASLFVAFGASFAYRREVFSWPNKYPAGIWSEDKVLPFRASMLGDVITLNHPLVVYSQSLETNSTSLVRNVRRNQVRACVAARAALEAAVHDGRYHGKVAEKQRKCIYAIFRSMEMSRKYSEATRRSIRWGAYLQHKYWDFQLTGWRKQFWRAMRRLSSYRK